MFFIICQKKLFLFVRIKLISPEQKTSHNQVAILFCGKLKCQDHNHFFRYSPDTHFQNCHDFSRSINEF